METLAELFCAGIVRKALAVSASGLTEAPLNPKPNRGRYEAEHVRDFQRPSEACGNSDDALLVRLWTDHHCGVGLDQRPVPLNMRYCAGLSLKKI